jgi:hypothetical protein
VKNQHGIVDVATIVPMGIAERSAMQAKTSQDLAVSEPVVVVVSIGLFCRGVRRRAAEAV